MNNINAKKAFLSKLQNYKKFFILSKYSLDIFASTGVLHQ